MRSTTPTANNFEEQLLKLAPYSVYNRKFPKHLDGTIRNYLPFLQETLSRGKLTSVSTVILMGFTKDDDQSNPKPIAMTLYAFGSFRRPYSAKKQLATVLAPFCWEILILPIIKPILSKDWQTQSQHQGQIYTEVQKTGIIVFSKKAEANYGT
jgi:hypothetical protein